MNYRKIYILLMIFAVMSVFLGGTLAYWTWETAESQRTEVVFTVEEEFKCAADGGGNITSEDIILAPSDCMNNKFAIQREIKVSPTLYSNQSTVLMDLWLDIDALGEGLSNSKNFRYALTTSANSCTDELVKTGNFYGKSIGDSVSLFNYNGYNVTTEETYYLYIWLDAKETSTETMYQTFNLSLNGRCMNAPEPKTYMVYDEEDTTLKLYKRDLEESVSLEDIEYISLEDVNYWSVEQLPWYKYSEDVTRIIVEDEISPISTANWFAELSNVEYIDVTELNTSNVTNMWFMFNNTGYNVDNFEIIGLDYFDTSKVTIMQGIFEEVGHESTSFNIGDISNWDVSNVINMEMMFAVSGYNAETWNIGSLSNWDISNVTDVSDMFSYAGNKTINWNIGALSNWDISNVTDMSYMFFNAGYSSSTFDIGDVSNWNTSNVTNMSYMFDSAGFNAMYTLDLSNWDVRNVTDYAYFNSGVTDKIIPPVWVN